MEKSEETTLGEGVAMVRHALSIDHVQGVGGDDLSGRRVDAQRATV